MFLKVSCIFFNIVGDKNEIDFVKKSSHRYDAVPIHVLNQAVSLEPRGSRLVHWSVKYNGSRVGQSHFPSAVDSWSLITWSHPLHSAQLHRYTHSLELTSSSLYIAMTQQICIINHT